VATDRRSELDLLTRALGRLLRIAFARIVTHYFSHGALSGDGTLLKNAGVLAGIPGVIVQGSLDLSNLLGTPGSWPTPGRTASWCSSTGRATTPATRWPKPWSP
jgi:hypothetical protein